MWSQTRSPQECALFIFIFSYLIHFKTPFVGPMMCADLEQHRIKVSHHRMYGDTHHKMERAWKALFYFLDDTKLNYRGTCLSSHSSAAWACDLRLKACLGAFWAHFSELLRTQLKSSGVELKNYKYLVMDTGKN